MIKQTAGERVFSIMNYVILILLAIITLFPFVYVILVSVTPASELVNVGKGILYVPKSLDFLAYKQIFETDTIPQAYKISIFVTVVGTVLSLLVTVLTAYPLSRRRLPGRSILLFIITFTMLFGGGLIPTYMVVRSLKLLDSVWALILPSTVSAFNLIIMKNYFLTIPDSLEESAKLDGANDFLILFRIILPLSLPMLATIALFYMVGYWNAFFNAIIYINNQRLYPLQVVLRQILFSASSDQVFNIVETTKASSLAVRMATIVVTTVPILVVYPFLQRYFTQGILLGSVKE
ncbi:carbohydrate ABC transporter permease [Mahella australiensis]|uniref:Carbohydrate ABC transporter membrane protein 2, CUT1 family n=1 Tax=Mahella australiensis (strain DSM 15567 / CIP 107919 / 50-1 BON) TaxID=697281 RepID=F3ZY22_MAHA5|nr:carbohydrate ABC transporter permease [Mahella australiensis]AEE97718.1 carbohydrate ABC transporter membrane protein 2, CUT1 family [Mahella australiensis 50-1 BON]